MTEEVKLEENLGVSSAPQNMAPKISPFLNPGIGTRESSLAVLHLRRDQLLPIVLRREEHNETGYREGTVTNTRFGSYPHDNLLEASWGTQVLASQVDTGSRGRKGDASGGKKRKEQASESVEDGNVEKKIKVEDEAASPTATPAKDASKSKNSNKKPAKAASTGFCHVVPPTPEAWTVSLPHRTQVVYTPDYSYILQKIRARPGCVVIEAGAGSGSFTHAAARAVFSGYGSPGMHAEGALLSSDLSSPRKRGKVYSFEYHEPRATQLRAEIDEHGLSSLVEVSHRDVYNDGFLVRNSKGDEQEMCTDISPLASQIFLDLPAPWQALPHLTRDRDGPLDPKRTAHICIFLPCIEQVQRAVTSLRAHGWVEIEMQELQHSRIEVRRELVGLGYQGLRSVNATPESVDEAVERLKEVEQNGRRYQNMMVEKAPKSKSDRPSNIKTEPLEDAARLPPQTKKADRLARNADEAASRKTFREGRLVHRTEPEIRTHTSYLIFAILPIEWTAEDEARCRRLWSSEKKSEATT